MEISDLEKLLDKTTDKLGFPIDEWIKPLVVLLNYHGIKTIASCEGHLDYGLPYPWIDCDINSLDSFIKLIENYLPDNLNISFMRIYQKGELKMTGFRITPSVLNIENGRIEFKNFEAYLKTQIN